jgi:hypothetical protein
MRKKIAENGHMKICPRWTIDDKIHHPLPASLLLEGKSTLERLPKCRKFQNLIRGLSRNDSWRWDPANENIRQDRHASDTHMLPAIAEDNQRRHFESVLVDINTQEVYGGLGLNC